MDYRTFALLCFFVIVEVRCFDDGVPKLSIDTTLEVPVLDINEAPYGIKINNSSFVFLNENPIAGEDVGILQCLDPDLGQAYSYEVLGESKKYFKVCLVLVVQVLQNETSHLRAKICMFPDCRGILFLNLCGIHVIIFI